MKKKGLGRGLSALLDDPTTDITTRSEVGHVQPRTAGGVSMMPLKFIEPNPFQPRTQFSDEALAELLAMPDPVLNASERVALYLQETRGRPFRRKDYMTFFPALSTASASRDLAQATTVGTLIRQGDKRNAMYSAG